MRPLTSQPLLALGAATVPVPAGMLHALLTIATSDPRTAVLTFPAWRARALAHLAATNQDLSTMPAAALLVLDVDAFRDLNTTWGHLAADQVLAQIADVLRRATSTRSRALVARYGGDEFIVFLPDADLRQARHLAERIRTEIAALQVLIHGPHGEPFGVATATISIGVAAHTIPAPPGDLDTVLTGLLWAADAALYAAKAAGGNDVRSASGSCRPLPPSPIVEPITGPGMV
jgi:diguanylate cyclase (GGDEF)-like protein